MTNQARRVVLIGYGMAGARLAEEVRRRDPHGERVALTVIGAETHAAYNRVLLSAVLAGQLKPDEITTQHPAWPEDHNVVLRRGVQATSIDRERRLVELDDDTTLRYDELVLATGSVPWIPPVDGLATDGRMAGGVAAFRDLDDCARILSIARAGTPVAVLGGGLLGLEAARGLAGRGARVTVVHPVEHLMERQLDGQGGAVLAATLAELGIEIRLNVLAKRWTPGHGLELDDGCTLPVDAVVVSAGVRPETGLALAAGLAVDKGIMVDERLTTSDRRIHAIGDCAQFPGTVAGLVQPSWDQAVVLADLLTGANPAARYRGTNAVTRLKARGIDLATLGEVHTERDASGKDTAEVLRLEDAARGRYAKLVLRGDKVTGAVMLGVPDAAATVIQLYDTGMPAPSDRLALLLGRALPSGAGPADSPQHLPARAVVCRCNNVTKGALVTAWRAGASSLAALTGATRASTGCGSCADVVAGIADWLATGESTGESTAESTAEEVA
ncbi:MAG TPA: FAD-dependent oxidoreductase [Kribbellaceae bacterium]